MPTTAPDFGCVCCQRNSSDLQSVDFKILPPRGLIADLMKLSVIQDNIRRDELKAFRKLADEMLMLDDDALAAAVKNGTIMEIECHG